MSPRMQIRVLGFWLMILAYPAAFLSLLTTRMLVPEQEMKNVILLVFVWSSFSLAGLLLVDWTIDSMWWKQQWREGIVKALSIFDLCLFAWFLAILASWFLAPNWASNRDEVSELVNVTIRSTVFLFASISGTILIYQCWYQRRLVRHYEKFISFDF